MPRNILMICYYYPPLVDVGCKRSVAFSKYFKEHGWNPVVLSVKNPDKAFCILGNDQPPPTVLTQYSYSVVNLYKVFGKLNGLLSRLLGIIGVRIERNFFYDILCIPDILCGWIPLTVLKGLKLINQLNIDTIYVSCPPFSAAIVGILLKRITGKPLVLDYRDVTQRLTYQRLPRLRLKIDRLIDDCVLKHCDMMITICEEAKDAHLERFPWLEGKIFVVHNGIDVESMPREQSLQKYSKFTVIYAGRYFYPFYAKDINPLFEALAMLKNMDIIDKNNFQLLIYGSENDDIKYLTHNYGIENLIVSNSRRPYEEILKTTLMAHLQFLRNPPLTIVTKLYDSIALNVPLLATIPKGEAQELIKEFSPASYIITSESAQDVKSAIIDAIEKYRNKKILNNKVSEFLTRFSRENQTLKLMQLIEENILPK